MLLIAKQARLHPFILGEISLGSQGAARAMLATIGEVRACVTATLAEVLAFITSASLHGTGIGYVDTHLLAATRLTPDGLLWTRDKRLHAQAERLGIAYTG